MNEEVEFDFDEILKEFRSGKKLTGKGGYNGLKNKDKNNSLTTFQLE